MEHTVIEEKNLNILKYIIDYEKITPKVIPFNKKNQSVLGYVLCSIMVMSGGISIYYGSKWLSKIYREHRMTKKRSSSSYDDTYELYKLRYDKNEMKVIHSASCHCSRVRFQIKSFRTLVAIDVSNKIRFPQIIVPCEDFEMISDEIVLSMYPVFSQMDKSTENISEGIIGVHTFCSFCGMQVLFSPSLDPLQVHINSDCLSRSNIDKLKYVYSGVYETVSCPTSYEPAAAVSRRGQGAYYVPSMISVLKFQKELNNRIITDSDESHRDSNDVTVTQNLWNIVSEKLSFKSTSSGVSSSRSTGIYHPNSNANNTYHDNDDIVFNREEEEDTTTEYFPSPPGSINGDIIDPLLSNTSLWDTSNTSYTRPPIHPNFNPNVIPNRNRNVTTLNPRVDRDYIANRKPMPKPYRKHNIHQGRHERSDSSVSYSEAEPSYRESRTYSDVTNSSPRSRQSI